MKVPIASGGYAARSGLFMAATFLAVGVYLPFFPVWLSGQNLTDPEIAFILSAPLFIRALSSPVLAWSADRLPDLGKAAALYAFLSAVSFAMLSFTSGFLAILVFSALAMVFWTGLVPIGDAIIVSGAKQHGFDYARVRLWGSVAFIFAIYAAARAIHLFGDDGVFILQVATFAIGGLVALWLPPVKQTEEQARYAGFGRIFRDHILRRALVAAGLVMAGHAAYYAFGTIYWLSLGFSDALVATLWTAGVVAEILLFWLVRRIPSWGARRYLIIGGVAAVVRWVLFAFAVTPLSAFLLNILHGLTFGAIHLGVIKAIGAVATPGHTARLQASYQLFGGLVLATGILAAGPLFAWTPIAAFWAMAVLGAAGLVLALGLPRGLQPQRAGGGGSTRLPT